MPSCIGARPLPSSCLQEYAKKVLAVAVSTGRCLNRPSASQHSGAELRLAQQCTCVLTLALAPFQSPNPRHLPHPHPPAHA